jgi:hypothetical protein
MVYTGGQVLNLWRTAERRLASLSPGSAEYQAVQTEIEHFRSTYDLFRR